jgi:hypothetical protein
MTEENDTPKTLGEMSHTNPFTGEVFGSTQTYDRGKTVAADGGEANSESRPPAGERAESDGGEDPSQEAATEDAVEGEELRDVDHTPPSGAGSANSVHQRGGEAKEDDV